MTTISGGAYLLVSNILYFHRISIAGVRSKALHSTSGVIRAIDYNYRQVLTFLFCHWPLFISITSSLILSEEQTMCTGAHLTKKVFGNLK